MMTQARQRDENGKNLRRVADNEARAKQTMIRISGQKLNLVAQSIRGKKVVKRFRARARGRAAKVLKPFSELTIIVREVEEAA